MHAQALHVAPEPSAADVPFAVEVCLSLAAVAFASGRLRAWYMPLPTPPSQLHLIICYLSFVLSVCLLGIPGLGHIPYENSFERAYLTLLLLNYISSGIIYEVFADGTILSSANLL
jgi:hypothetical protein